MTVVFPFKSLLSRPSAVIEPSNFPFFKLNRHKTGKKSSLQDRAGHFGQFRRLTAAPTLAALKLQIFKYKILDTLYSKLVFEKTLYQFEAIESLERPDFCFSREKIDARKFDWPKWPALSCIG